MQPRYTDTLWDPVVGYCCWRIALVWARDPPLDEKQRGRLTALQRILICKMSLLCRSVTETAKDFFKRRERVATGSIERYGRSKWGALQKYRAMNFIGHVTRIDSQIHPVGWAHRWRDLAWWTAYQNELPAKSRVQRGRRPPLKGNACRCERLVSRPFKKLLGHSCWPRVKAALETELGIEVSEDLQEQDWRTLALSREVWRAFARWTSFKQEM